MLKRTAPIFKIHLDFRILAGKSQLLDCGKGRLQFRFMALFLLKVVSFYIRILFPPQNSISRFHTAFEKALELKPHTYFPAVPLIRA